MPTGAALFEQFINGLTIGMVYVLLAAGLSIIFGVMDVINFAHGELYALGAYFAVAIAAPFDGAGFWIALVVAPLLVGGVGMAIERLTLRPLYDRNPLYHILLTFGLVLVFKDVIPVISPRGNQAVSFPIPAGLDQPIGVLGVGTPLYGLFIIVVGTALAAGTWLGLNYTRVGLVVRAGAQDREMVRNLGIDIDRYYTLVFGFGAALAAVAGIVLGAFQRVEPGMGDSVIIPAFVIVVLGGLGSFRGAVVGGLGVGLIQTLARTYVPFLEGLVVYLLMILVLLVRPQGLFGDPEWETGGARTERLFDVRHEPVLSPEQRRWGALALVVVLAVLPLGVGTLYTAFTVSLLIDVLVWALFALSLDFVMGYAGLVSLGHALFYGLGSYVVVLAVIHLAPSAFVALALAVLVAAAAAWVVGYLSIRVSGVYFAMITLGFAQLVHNAVFKFEVLGSSDGLRLEDAPLYGFGGVGVKLTEIGVVSQDVLFYYFLLLVVGGTYLVTRRIMRAPFGSVLQSIRESEQRASFVGYDVTAYKRRAFTISGALAGLAGGLLALDGWSATPSLLHWLRSGEVIVTVILGGMGTLFGPIVGAAVFIEIRDMLSSYVGQWQLVLGLLFVAFVIFVPRGLMSVPRLSLDRFGVAGTPATPGELEDGTEEVETGGDDP